MIKKYLYKIIVAAIAVGMLAIYVGCNSDKKTGEQNQAKVNDQQENIIRAGIIDVTAIDVNKDGKVFQCPMDWNVIDDKEGTCPTCKMEFEEVTVEKARENLVKNDYKVK